MSPLPRPANIIIAVIAAIVALVTSIRWLWVAGLGVHDYVVQAPWDLFWTLAVVGAMTAVASRAWRAGKNS